MSSVSDQIDKDAAAWVMRERDGLDQAETSELRAWMDQSPAHAEAYGVMRSAWDGLGSIADSPEIAMLRADALRPSRSDNWPRIAAFAASLLLVVTMLIFSGMLYAPRKAPAAEIASVWQTHKGQSQKFTLADGSIVTLDSNSAIEVRLRSDRRDIRLTRGRGYFQVAHDTARPFVVTAGGRSVIAVGTEFGVSTDARLFEVALTQGRILVQPSDVPSKSGKVRETLSLTPGQRLVFDVASRRTTVTQGDPASLVGWRMGRLRFDDARLADAVDEINRYSERPLRLADASLANLRVSGVFRTDQPENFTQTLTILFPVRAETDERETLLWRRAIPK